MKRYALINTNKNAPLKRNSVLKHYVLTARNQFELFEKMLLIEGAFDNKAQLEEFIDYVHENSQCWNPYAFFDQLSHYQSPFHNGEDDTALILDEQFNIVWEFNYKNTAPESSRELFKLYLQFNLCRRSYGEQRRTS